MDELKIKKRTLFKAMSIFFFLFGVAIFLTGYYEGNAASILWLCSASIFLLAIGLWLENNFIISTTLTASFLLNFIWATDFIGFILTGSLPIGIAQYLKTASILRKIMASYHLFLLVVSLAVVFKTKKFHKYSWLGASSFLLILSLLSLAFSKRWANVNCVFELCNVGTFSFLEKLNQIILNFLPSFILHWLFATIVIFIPTSFFFKKMVKWIAK